jgi:hypothetical protein
VAARRGRHGGGRRAAIREVNYSLAVVQVISITII